MNIARTLALAGLGTMIGLAPQSVAAQKTQFTVRIENVSTAKTLKLSNGETAPAPTSPGLWVIYKGTGNPLFVPGEKDRGEGLELLAETGNPSKLVASMNGMGMGIMDAGAFTTPQGESEAGPLLPGKVFEFSFTAEPGERLALAFMFGQSNDLFYAPGPKGIALFDSNGNPTTEEITTAFELWDAGTEVNQEPGLGADQAPRQMSPDQGTVERKAIAHVKDAYNYPPVAGVISVNVSSTRVASAKN